MTVVPAIFAAIAIMIALALALVPTDLQRRLDTFVARGGRLARIAQRLANVPAAFSAGMRVGAATTCAAATRRSPARSSSGASTSATLWASFHAFGHAPSIWVIAMGYFVGMLGNLLPLPGGVGGVDGGMIGAFSAFGVDFGLATVAVLVYRGVRVLAADDPGRDRLLPAAQDRATLAGSSARRSASSPPAGVVICVGVTILSEVTTETDRIENVVIVGSGPAGYTAALYTSRANLQPLVIEGFLWGGLLQQTTDVENYPGFPAGIMGPELMQHMRDQAERFGTRFVTDLATKIELGAEPGGLHTVWVGDEAHRARTVILAMGAEHKKLGVPGEEELSGRGVSYCATCDAAFFKDRPIDRRRRRRQRDGGGDLPREVRLQGQRRPPPRRVPRVEDHARAREGDREHRVADAVRRRGVPAPGEGHDLAVRAAAQHRDRRGARARGHRRRSSRSATSRSRRSCAAWSTPTTRAT